MINSIDIAVELVRSQGHVNVTASHRSTIEITRDDYLTPLGDCIVGVKADKAPRDFSERFKQLAKDDNSIILVIFLTENNMDVVLGRGSKDLLFTNDRKMIIRKSSYVDDATVVVNASKAAIELSRKLVEDLVNGSFLYTIFIVFRMARSTR